MKIDMHTHVLPEVDHGAVDWDMSLQMLVKSAECGVETVIATPHYLPWKEGVTAEVICKLCVEAKKRLQREYGISMDIYPGNEIYYSSDTVELLKTGKVLTLAGTQYVLIEFQQEVSYQMLCKAARDLRFHGYIPIFAHIERYFCVDHIKKILQLKEIGGLLQVNVGAFQGSLFDAKNRKVKKWLKEGIIDFVASDMHDLKQRPPMSNERLEWVQKKLELQYQDKLLYGNAQDILISMKE